MIRPRVVISIVLGIAVTSIILSALHLAGTGSKLGRLLPVNNPRIDDPKPIARHTHLAVDKNAWNRNAQNATLLSIGSRSAQRSMEARDHAVRERAALVASMLERTPGADDLADYVVPSPESLQIGAGAAPALFSGTAELKVIGPAASDAQSLAVLLAAYSRFCSAVRAASCSSKVAFATAAFDSSDSEWRCSGCGALDDTEASRAVVRIAVEVSMLISEAPLRHGHDESYSLDVLAGESVVRATTVWGALHALQTLQQLILPLSEGKQRGSFVPFAPLSIRDKPRWKWRGLLVDSARHFVRLETLKAVVDGLAHSKMNVLHWHICDSQSFPLALASAPELALRANLGGTYTAADVRALVTYAHERGVRVMPEIDVPAHATSWGKGYPGITVDCHTEEGALGNRFALNPANPRTVEIMRAVLTEVASLFTDEYFHIGVDEVNFRSCWDQNPDVSTFLHQKRWTGHDALKYLVAQAAGAVRAMNKTPIVWQEGLEAELPGDHAVQVWQCWGEPSLGADGMRVAAQRGLPSIQSTCWYLDWELGWEFFYRRHSIDVWPVGAPGVSDSSVLGGEVALWSERTDDARVLCRIWPRAAAVADRLWADKGREELGIVEARMSQFRNRLVRWGIAAAELEPGAKGRSKFGSQCPLLPK